MENKMSVIVFTFAISFAATDSQVHRFLPGTLDCQKL